jgi:GIY-YIG catalytic domain.
MIAFHELVDFRKILNTDSSTKIKYVRHKDSRAEYREMLKDREQLINYQKQQSEDVFNCDYIISFIGQEGSKSIFWGVFKVQGCVFDGEKYQYNLEKQSEFNAYEDRVVIDWGAATRKWHQWALGNDNLSNHKEVIEVLPKGYLDEFTGLLDFILEFHELEKLINNPDANKAWKYNLSSINGIYLILDKSTGNQYIGSAYGKDGIWQRWESYVKSKTGGNKKLIELIEKDPEHYKNFRFTILQSLPSNIQASEVIKLESLYKEKFGTKAFGLNDN